MPYKTVTDAEKKNKGLAKYSQKAKRGWLSSFNSCLESGSAEDKCFAVAYSVANKVDGKKASGAIRIDKSAIKRLQKELIKDMNRYVSRKDADKELGKVKSITQKPFTLKMVDGEMIDITVVLRSVPSSSPSFVSGAGVGKAPNGNQVVVIDLNGRYSVSAFKDTKESSDLLWDHLIHEITHVADKFKKEKKTENGSRVKNTLEVDLDEYYNDPAEVRAYMQEVVDQVINNYPKLQRYGRKGLDYALNVSSTWKEISPYLNRKNRGKILSAVGKAVSEWEDDNHIGYGKVASIVHNLVADAIAESVASSYLAGCGCQNVNVKIELDVNDFEEDDDDDDDEDDD